MKVGRVGVGGHRSNLLFIIGETIPYNDLLSSIEYNLGGVQRGQYDIKYKHRLFGTIPIRTFGDCNRACQYFRAMDNRVGIIGVILYLTILHVQGLRRQNAEDDALVLAGYIANLNINPALGGNGNLD